MDRPERRWCRRVLGDTQDRSTCSAASTTTSYEHQIATTQPRERRNSTLSTLDNATTASTPSRSRPSAAWTRRPRRPEQPAVSRSRFPFGLLLCMGQRASEPGPRSRSLGTTDEKQGGRSYFSVAFCEDLVHRIGQGCSSQGGRSARVASFLVVAGSACALRRVSPARNRHRRAERRLVGTTGM